MRKAGARGIRASHTVSAPGEVSSEATLTGVPGVGGLAEAQGEPAPPRERSVFGLTYRLVEDLQRVRLAHGNRVRQVLPLIPDHVLPPRGTPSWEAFFKHSAEVLDEEEKRVLKLAKKILEDEPIGRWMLDQKGIGPSLGVSILGEVWPLDRFASPRKLWAYAGLAVTTDGKAVRRRKGVRSNWNSRLKTRLYLFGVSILKAGDSPWRALYDTRKAYEVARAPASLVSQDNNVPGEIDAVVDAGALQMLDDQVAGAPGAHVSDAIPESSAPGTLSKLQIHYRALRVVEKALLLDLWRLAHGQTPLVGVTE